MRSIAAPVESKEPRTASGILLLLIGLAHMAIKRVKNTKRTKTENFLGCGDKAELLIFINKKN
jgi:hypothetical protein